MRNIPPTGVRIPDDLKDKLDEASKDSNRSLNSEIINRLKVSFELQDRPLASYPDADLVRELLLRYKHGDIAIRIGDGLFEKRTP